MPSCSSPDLMLDPSPVSLTHMPLSDSSLWCMMGPPFLIEFQGMQLRTWSHSNHRALPTVWAYATLGMTRTYLFVEFADFASQSTLDNYN
jgi:hypothetical protein